MYRNMQYPDGIMINGQVNDLAKQENSILANCFKIIASATGHDARFVVEAPASLARTSPYAQRGHETHASI